VKVCVGGVRARARARAQNRISLTLEVPLAHIFHSANA